MEEKQTTLTEKEINEIKEKGWKSVVIDERQPLGAVIDFFNILNQRLAFVEDMVHFNNNGKDMTISQYYQEQQELALKQMQKQSNEVKGE